MSDLSSQITAPCQDFFVICSAALMQFYSKKGVDFFCWVRDNSYIEWGDNPNGRKPKPAGKAPPTERRGEQKNFNFFSKNA